MSLCTVEGCDEPHHARAQLANAQANLDKMKARYGSHPNALQREALAAAKAHLRLAKLVVKMDNARLKRGQR